jgi:hypothetical protein
MSILEYMHMLRPDKYLLSYNKNYETYEKYTKRR